MDVLERVICFAIGSGLGFLAGYIVASLREIKEEVDEMLDIEKGSTPDRPVTKRDERGFIRYPVLADAMLLVVLVLTVYAAFVSQAASNDVRATQESQDQVTECNKVFLTRTIDALNERTTYTQAQAQANVELQRAQTRLLAVLLEEPPPSDARSEVAFNEYFETLTNFVTVNSKYADKVETNPYPTTDEVEDCLNSEGD